MRNKPKIENICGKCWKVYKSSVIKKICPSCRLLHSKKNKWTLEKLYCPKCLSDKLVEGRSIMAGAKNPVKAVLTLHCESCGKNTRVSNVINQERFNIINNIQ